MKQSRTITFILHRPSEPGVQEVILVQEFREHDGEMYKWLKEQFIEAPHRAVNVLPLVDGIPLWGLDRNTRCDVEAIVLFARRTAISMLTNEK